MEKKEGKERANLKLFFLDLFPSYEEIDEANDGIIISFQNEDLRYNLLELIKNREEMFVPQQIPNQIIKINLLKGNNPYATGSFTVKNGEQWVTFSYEHKKKQATNFALSLIDCIKIKFLCKIDYVPAINNNLQLTNTEFQPSKNDSILANIMTKPSPKKLYGNFTSKKKNSYNNEEKILVHDSLRTEESKISKILDNISSSEMKSNNNLNLNNTTLNSSKNNSNPLLKSENLSEFNPLASSSEVLGKDFKNNEKNKTKNIKKIYTNNLINNNKLDNKKSNDMTLSSQKNKNKSNDKLNKVKGKANNNSSSNIVNTIENKNTNENNKSKQNLKKNKSKNLMDNNCSSNNNKSQTNKKEKPTKNITKGNLININFNEQKPKKFKKDISSKIINPKNEEIIDKNGENNVDNRKNSIQLNKEDIESTKDINNNINDNTEVNEENINHDDEENNIPSLEEYNNDLENLELDNFSKKLEDFQLLYNDEYIKNIKIEDYSLEIELYLEKLIELINEYHIQLEEKDIEYQLIKNMYHNNINQYLEIRKLNNKLQLMKDNYFFKKLNSNPINQEHDKNYINNLITNKVEINMFNFIIYSQKEKDQKEKREKIKKILKNILNKPKNENIINQNGEISKWVKLNMEQSNQVKEKGKKKGKIQKSKPESNADKGENKKKKNLNNNSNNTPSKVKNKFNKNSIEEKRKK